MQKIKESFHISRYLWIDGDGKSKFKDNREYLSLSDKSICHHNILDISYFLFSYLMTDAHDYDIRETYHRI